MQGKFSSARRATAVMTLLVLAACTGAGRLSGRIASNATGTPSASSTAATLAGSSIRTCRSSVYGDIGTDWRDRSLVVGPIAFVGLPSWANPQPDGFGPIYGGALGVTKVLVVVDRGSEVTVSISPKDQAHLALLYDPSDFKDFNSYQIADGERAMTFQACPPGNSPFGAEVTGSTQFNGGFIVDGPQCATIQVSAGRGSPKDVVVSFGMGRCS